MYPYTCCRNNQFERVYKVFQGLKCVDQRRAISSRFQIDKSPVRQSSRTNVLASCFTMAYSARFIANRLKRNISVSSSNYILSGRRFKSTAAPVEQTSVEIFVDGKPIKVSPNQPLIQACEKAGATIPRFCYHERLQIAGNCRMCLVEVEKVPKPVASCAYPIMPGMKVFTDTPMVHKAREGVMEFLLANHPLDCPICDQGGECDLQDQSVRYGSDRGRFREVDGKRAVEDKDFGPLVKTTMTRCIHCTRCVRFANEVAGAEELGTSGRGNDMQIGTYIEKAVDSEMSGNIIDLCPVGALTSKPYEFKARPWELKKTESIDVMDAIGSNIRVDSRGVEVMRVLPRVNDDVNEEWINDKTRFACDGLKRQRLTAPLMKVDGKLVQVSWKDALLRASEEFQKFNGNQVTAIAGQHADLESMVALKDLMSRMDSNNFLLDGLFLKQELSGMPVPGVDFRSNYIFNSTLAGISKADSLLLIGSNPRREAPSLNIRIRKSWIGYGVNVGLIGQPDDLTYSFDHIGTSISSLYNDFEKHPFFQGFKSASRPAIIVGSGAIENPASGMLFDYFSKLVKKVPNLVNKDWNGFNVLQRHASMTGALDIGFVPGPNSTALKDSKIVYLLNADQITEQDIPSDAFVIYQGHHGDAGAHLADLVLPGATYTEKSATFVNTEGRSQMTRAAVKPPGAAREDWMIVRALSEFLGLTLPYNEVYDIRERMAEYAPHLIRYGDLIPSAFTMTGLETSTINKKSVPADIKSLEMADLLSPISNFYHTDPISRASPTMAKCSAAFKKNVDGKAAKLSAQA